MAITNILIAHRLSNQTDELRLLTYSGCFLRLRQSIACLLAEDRSKRSQMVMSVFVSPGGDIVSNNSVRSDSLQTFER